jgi:predicted enzyme related to lactoylglutathione lyase
MSHQLEKAVVWSEIPVTDMQKAMAFYNAVFGYELTLDTSGPNPMAIFPAKEAKGSCGHLYPGKPARDGEGPTLHLGVPGKLEDAMARLRSAGGTLLPVPPISIPSGRFVYAKDPDGNSIGLFEPAVS